MKRKKKATASPAEAAPAADVPAAAAIIPPVATTAAEPAPLVDPEIATKLKNTREQREVVGPLVMFLRSMGWNLDQLEFGTREWRVPKAPSEATKRERGNSFEGFPCDVAVFDSAARKGDPQHLLIIVEAKTSDETVGVAQLETYMALEPYARVGVWVNDADPSAPAVFVYRNERGNFVRRRRLLNDMPRPGERISEEQKRLTFNDLTIPSEQAIRRTIEDLLDRVVIDDPKLPAGKSSSTSCATSSC